MMPRRERFKVRRSMWTNFPGFSIFESNSRNRTGLGRLVDSFTLGRDVGEDKPQNVARSIYDPRGDFTLNFKLGRKK